MKSMNGKYRGKTRISKPGFGFLRNPSLPADALKRRQKTIALFCAIRVLCERHFLWE
jgi:hypothetical protein